MVKYSYISITVHPRAGGNPDLQMVDHYYVYILASKRNGTLYVGFTTDLTRRIKEHKGKTFEGFTKEYNITNLVYYEIVEGFDWAIKREKQIKKWNRAWKLRLIEEKNPTWRDLYSDFLKKEKEKEIYMD